MIEWFYGKEGQQYGPIDEATLRARASTGEVGPHDLVWREGMENWKPLMEIAELGGGVTMPPPVASSDGGVSPAVPNSPYAPPVGAPGGAAYRPAPGLPVTNGLSIASLVCGILSLVFFCLCGGVLFGLPAIICGHIGLSQMNVPENQQQGRGLAIAGLVCGYCGLAIFALMFVQGNVDYRFNDFNMP